MIRLFVLRDVGTTPEMKLIPIQDIHMVHKRMHANGATLFDELWYINEIGLYVDMYYHLLTEY